MKLCYILISYGRRHWRSLSRFFAIILWSNAVFHHSTTVYIQSKKKKKKTRVSLQVTTMSSLAMYRQSKITDDELAARFQTKLMLFRDSSSSKGLHN
jgi:hypothetical protein